MLFAGLDVISPLQSFSRFNQILLPTHQDFRDG
jgi:hypothetical protein